MAKPVLLLLLFLAPLVCALHVDSKRIGFRSMDKFVEPAQADG